MHAQIIKLLQAYVPNQSLYRFLSKNNKPLVFIMGKRNAAMALYVNVKMV